MPAGAARVRETSASTPSATGAGTAHAVPAPGFIQSSRSDGEDHLAIARQRPPRVIDLQLQGIGRRTHGRHRVGAGMRIKF